MYVSVALHFYIHTAYYIFFSVRYTIRLRYCFFQRTANTMSDEPKPPATSSNDRATIPDGPEWRVSEESRERKHGFLHKRRFVTGVYLEATNWHINECS